MTKHKKPFTTEAYSKIRTGPTRGYVNGQIFVVGASPEIIEPEAAITVAKVGALLQNAGIVGFTDEGVDELRAKLSLMYAVPRFEGYIKGIETAVDALRRLLPEVIHAARAYHDERVEAFSVFTQHLILPEQEARLPAANEIHHLRLEALTALANSADCAKNLLPPSRPRQQTPWHDDARELAKVLEGAAEAAGITVGIRRADSKGIIFVRDALESVGVINASADAVAKALRGP